MAPSHRQKPPCGPATCSGNAEPVPASETSSATPDPGPEPGPEPRLASAPVLSPVPVLDTTPAVAYTKADLQKLLRIFMSTKVPSNNKPCENPLRLGSLICKWENHT